MATNTNTFGIWLKRKYLDSAMEHIEEEGIKSQADFARWLDISTQNLTHYMTDGRKPTGEFIDLLADKLGMEVYDMLELSRKVPDEKTINYLCGIWHRLDEDDKNKIYEIVVEIVESKKQKKVG